MRDRRQYWADYYRRNRETRAPYLRQLARNYRARNRIPIKVAKALQIPISEARRLLDAAHQ